MDSGTFASTPIGHKSASDLCSSHSCRDVYRRPNGRSLMKSWVNKRFKHSCGRRRRNMAWSSIKQRILFTDCGRSPSSASSLPTLAANLPVNGATVAVRGDLVNSDLHMATSAGKGWNLRRQRSVCSLLRSGVVCVWEILRFSANISARRGEPAVGNLPDEDSSIGDRQPTDLKPRTLWTT